MTYEEKLKYAHSLCSNNKKILKEFGTSHCFYCYKSCKFSEIEEWVDTNGATGLCPHCGIDSLIPALEMVNEKFLKDMYYYWFVPVANGGM